MGFCNGNSGDEIFSETFGTGTGYNTLPVGTTTYNFNSGYPDDGFYTVHNGTVGNAFDWHQIEDHTSGDSNGKCLIVNAGFSSGEFYRSTISGLCERTTYEFSSWLINLVVAGSFCSTQPSGTIPINVRFEIWDVTDTTLLALGDTGNIIETFTPNWEQFGLVFQTAPSQTSVIIKMINNGIGGCGNDLAIDDIVFKTCGDYIGVIDPLGNNSITICSGETPYNTTVTATPDGSVFSTHFYQWQQSIDGSTWTDMAGETNQTLSISGITSTMYYRAKVAEYAINLSNLDCITYSETYLIVIDQAPAPPILECWETANINNATCTWDITGSQPSVPTGLECWETALFNNVTCSWDITGSQPSAPTGLECWETALFNNATCSWDITGSQPSAPTGLECWETTIFNNSTCDWDIIGTQPSVPSELECWEIAVFNITTCDWDIEGEQHVDTIEEFVLLCDGGIVTLNADSILVNPTYLWNTGETTEEIQVTNPGNFTVEITDIGCLSIIKTIHVSLIETPQILSIYSNGNTINVEMINNGEYEYSLDNLQYQFSNVFVGMAGGLYTIYVRDIYGCEIVTQEYLHFIIPKFFTPNNDGFNDTFSLNGLEYFNSSSVYIYDRFGKLLKNSNNQSFDWDGTFNNQKLPNSDYWYIIKINNQIFKGHFTLKR